MTDDALDRLRTAVPPGLQIPPPVFTEMRAEVVGYEEGRSMRVRFPFDARYANPAGIMQGGAIAAAIDNTLGPLSYLVAPPGVTTQLNLSYLRPVTPDLAYYEVEARLDERTRHTLYMSARVTDPEGNVLVLAQATQFILPQRKRDGETSGADR